MIYLGTQLKVADNSGARIVECIKVMGSTGKDVASVGQIIVVSVKDAAPRTKVNKGAVYHAVVVRTKSTIKRADGSIVTFDENAAVLIDKKKEMLGTRVFGPIPRELRYVGFLKIISLAQEII